MHNFSIEEYDLNKTKVLKYVLYKKRTKYEIKQKFIKQINSDLLEKIIEELEKNDYINDKNYIARSVDEYIALKTMSIKEIKYKIIQKGIESSLIDEYIQKNGDSLMEYEQNSIRKIIEKKQNTLEKNEIIMFLKKKGYKDENIRGAFEI